jgi:hypothetical protein
VIPRIRRVIFGDPAFWFTKAITRQDLRVRYMLKSQGLAVAVFLIGDMIAFSTSDNIDPTDTSTHYR